MEIYVSKLMVVSEISRRRRVMCDAYGFPLLTMGGTEDKHVNVWSGKNWLMWHASFDM